LLLQKTFLLRTCENAVFGHRSRPCLLHQIHLCKGPCVGLVSAEEYARDVRMAELFLRGRQGEVIEGLTARMQEAAEGLRFEEAAALRDQVRALQAVLHRQYVSSTREEDADILAAVVVHGELCVNLAMVRGGLHLGDRAFFPKSGEGEADAAEGLAAFIEQHYLEHQPPARLIVGSDIGDETAAVFADKKINVGAARNEMERAWLSMAEKNAELAITSRRHAKARAGGRLEALRAALDLPEAPARVECFDISHTMGEGTVASCVVCVDGAMKKSDYRRFNIAGIEPGDDYAAMRQALTRRYEKVATGESVAPDLILIDGGKGQHRVAREVLAELNLDHLATVGIAKGEERKPGLETLFVHGRAEPLQLAPDNAGFHLIQEIRDEAHRFAIAGHRARRAKARGRSKLEDVPGIGPARRRKLLAHFGGLDGVAAATVEDLRRVEGISRKLAEEIYSALH
jgi:excinuclease ABC subunit C